MPLLTTAWRKTISAWMQYLYFLRIPILGWIALPLFCLVDWRTGASALTRGIITVQSGWQAFYVAFFVTSMGMATLICVRNILRNGRDRFASEPPIPLFRLYCSRRRSLMWTALAIAHLPTALTLAYVICITIQEKESVVFGPHYGLLFWAVFLGVLAALFFWYLVSLFYLWTYPNTGNKPAVAIFSGELPLFAVAMAAQKPLFAVWAEHIAVWLMPLSPEGYRSRGGVLRELHFLTTVALAGFLALYLMLYPLIAPVYFSRGILDRVGAVCLFALCVWGARRQSGGWDPISHLFLSIKFVFLVVFLLMVYYDSSHRVVLLETAFPTFASILVIVIFLQWLLAGASFFFDRYRAPVLSVVVLLIFLPKFLPVDQDHYFDAVQASYLKHVDSPLEALQSRVGKLKDPDEPLIIVTASGGGIQAAAWTANVMAQLEKSFNQDPELSKAAYPYTFHEHLLMASGVSGGSLGLMPFLLEYTADKPFSRDDKDIQHRIVKPIECSSLEAVAWGLEYYDLQRLFLTYRPSSLHYGPSDYPNLIPGEMLPFFPDRTWALTRAFNRNLKDEDCGTAELWRPQGLRNGEELTLKQAAGLLNQGSMPAFTFNTTVAETGGRFLLSNYDVPRMPKPYIGTTDFMPAESFLKVYTQEPHCDAATLNAYCYADIALSTAARLSATFPVVSSATRIPPTFAKDASHFLDGGYYDNDGTASVSEFLYAVMEERHLMQEKRKKERTKWEALKDPVGPEPDAISYPNPLRILLIEIRDGVDLNPETNLDNWEHQTGATVEPGSSKPREWSIFQQILAPVEGLWNAGHVSTTLRNRQQLCVLEQAYAGRPDNALYIHHIVLGIPPAPVDGRPGEFMTPPLSWKLTNRQVEYIRQWVTAPEQPSTERKQTMRVIQEGIDWVKTVLKENSAKNQGSTEIDPSSTYDDSVCRLSPEILAK